MFENIASFFKKVFNKAEQNENNSKTAAKERLQLVLMQDRANVSADFLDLMRQEIIEVIKKYITVDEKEIDVRLINKENEDGTNGAPALVANIPILSVKNENKKEIEKNSNLNVGVGVLDDPTIEIKAASENDEEGKEENKKIENIQEKEVEQDNKEESKA